MVWSHERNMKQPHKQALTMDQIREQMLGVVLATLELTVEFLEVGNYHNVPEG